MKKRSYNRAMSATDKLAQKLETLHAAGEIQYNELAEKAGIHRVTLAKIVSRRQEDVSFDVVVRLAQAANISLDAICDLQPATN